MGSTKPGVNPPAPPMLGDELQLSDDGLQALGRECPTCEAEPFELCYGINDTWNHIYFLRGASHKERYYG